MKKKYICIITVLAAMLTACDIQNVESVPDTQTEPIILTQAPEPQAYPVVVGGVKVLEQPQRIVSLSPAITEMLAEMSYNGRICAIGSYCDYPLGIEQLDNVGSIVNPDIDKIISLNADMVLTTAPIAAKDIVILESNGVKPIMFTSPRTLAELSELYRTLGILLDGELEGASFGETAYKKISEACEKAKSVTCGSFIYITTEMMLSGKDTFEDDVLSLFGTNLISSDGYALPENIDFTTQPETVFCSNEFTVEQLCGNAIYGGLEAVQSGEVVFLDNKLFERPSGRIAQQIDAVCLALGKTSDND